MTIMTKLAGTALTALVLTTSLAQAATVSQTNSNNNIATQIVFKATASCVLAHGEFPDDIFVVNSGLVTLKAGAKVQWKVPAGNAAGVLTLVADLAPGKNVFLKNVVPGGVEASNPCNAKLI
jgi:hypothetical protein